LNDAVGHQRADLVTNSVVQVKPSLEPASDLTLDLVPLTIDDLLATFAFHGIRFAPPRTRAAGRISVPAPVVSAIKGPLEKL
jgi:hypothetical protein